MLWIALHCPRLALDCIERRLPHTVRPALAITVRKGNRLQILIANDTAHQAGVRTGQSISSTLSILPDVILIEQDEVGMAQALKEAGCSVLRFTPNVVSKSTGLIAEIASSVRLFGGRKSLVKQIVETAKQQGLQVTIGLAPTAGAAWLLAQAASIDQISAASSKDLTAHLDRLPIDLLVAAQAHLDTLQGIGCSTLADLEALPRKGLARRFGTGLLTELDTAYGRVMDPQVWLEVPESFNSKLELMARVENVEALLFAVKRMVGQLAGWLSLRHAAVQALTFVLHHESSRRYRQAPTTLTIRLAEASNDPNHLIGLLREHLDRTELIAPVEELELIADEIKSATVPNQELFPTAQSEASSLNRLIEKLSARLGATAVRRIQNVADHRPEKSQALIEVAHTARRPDPLEVEHNLIRPSWLLAQPLALKIRQHKPVYGSVLDLLAGPERIEGGWWDDDTVTRDYFIAENQLGQLLWVFKQRLPKAQHGGWYLHGLFG